MDNIMPTTMAFLWFIMLLLLLSSQNKPPIDPLEQNALYNLLNSLNPTIPWTTLFPDDLCITAPRFVVCESYRQQNQTKSHIVQLTFPPCSPNATLNPSLFTPFTYIRKITFSNCFNNTHKPTHLLSLPPFPYSLQELIFIDNPSIFSPLQPFIHNLTSLKKLVLVGNAFHGQLPPQIADFHNLQELNLSRNNLSGDVPASIGMLKKLEILDLSDNGFKGCVPEQVGNLTSLVKLNLSRNGFACEIPTSFIHLKNLTYLGLDNNKLEGSVPEEFGFLLKSANEINLENNNLSGTITFPCGGVEQKKLKLAGNKYLESNDNCKTTGDVLFNEGSLQLFDPLVLLLGFIMLFVFLLVFVSTKKRITNTSVYKSV